MTDTVGSTAALLLGSVAAVGDTGVAVGAVETGAAVVVVVVVGEVVVVVAVAVTCRISAAGSAGCDGGIVSGSRSSSEARNLAIVFRACSGNGPD